ncbi:MAG: VCBS repeat-containing protein [Planctomycetota bacterium]
MMSKNKVLRRLDSAMGTVGGAIFSAPFGILPSVVAWSLLISSGHARADCPSFVPQTIQAVGSGPRAVAVGDFDGDGAIDLAVTNAAANSVSILMGNCDGTYTRQDIEAVGASPWNIAAVDIDHDGDLDLIITNSDGGNIRVLRNQGGGQFTLEPTVPTGAGAHWIATADFDGDGHIDLAVANYFDNTLTLLWNDGSGSFFAQGNPLACGPLPYTVVAGDYDGDGRPDLALTNDFNETVSLFHNLGSRNFAARETITLAPPGDGLGGIVFARLNNDQNLDLAVSNITSGLVYLLFGNGDGTFSGRPPLNVTTAHDLAISDIDRNGTLDLVVACYQPTNSLAYILNDGMGGFAAPIYLPAGNGPVFAKAADLDGDTDQDIVLVNYNVSGSISIYYNRCISADTDVDGVYDSCDRCPFDPTNTMVDGKCIPTLSEWGMVAMAALMLAAGAVVVSRRRAAG